MPTIPERLTAIETTQASMFGVLTKIDHSINGNDQPGMKQNYVELKGKVDNACMSQARAIWERYQWTTEIPNQAGYYWFYGDAFTLDLERNCRNELHFVVVRKISNGYCHVASGNFMENKKGKWKVAEIPEFPAPYSLDKDSFKKTAS
jgi:hypothetical protein